ncbi:MAG TPA: methyltransferase domain-containing protein [Gemmataceae bacterium]|jgi:SAM-dependent methyltransferase|nr:methyltransferase domain-containing protein [Gemmataceae bacterium]
MFPRLWKYAINRVSRHCDRWTARRVRPLVRRGDHLLNIGSRDGRLDLLLRRDPGCEVVVDPGHLPLPFSDDRFDVVLLVSVLHHVDDPRTVLEEARRVSRRQVIVLEDVNSTRWDRLVFRAFHRWIQTLPTPYRKWSPEQWSQLAAEAGLREEWSGLVGRQMGYFAPRQIMFEWQKPVVKMRKAA